MKVAVIHSQRRRRSSTRGSTHSPSVRQREGGPYRFQNASARHSNVAALNHGRQASRAVRFAIHAPLMPISTSASGTTQQTDAPTAARVAPTMAGSDVLVGFVLMGAY